MELKDYTTEELKAKLKEREDERIRKDLIALLHFALDNGSTVAPGCRTTKEQAIAWLEKQSEQKPMKVYRVENEAEQKGLWRKFDGTWQPLFDMLTDGKCKDMPMEDSPIYREGGKRWFASAPSKEALQKWFSKRDLEELVSKGFTISEFEVIGYKKVSDFEYIFTRENIINRNYLEVSDIYSEQKDFAPKVEPKFKVGDWIINKSHDICLITDIDLGNGYYICDSNRFGNTDGDIDLTDKAFHLWTIQDAKDGDVLVHNSIIFIFMRIKNGVVKGICAELSDTISNFGKPEYDNDYCPATKEQRDLLFSKMKEAGYKWDDVKKELRKIEKKPIVIDEPKFHEGDWVVISTTNGNRVVQIASVEYFTKDGYPSYITTEGRWFGNTTKARLLTDKDVGITTVPESKAVVNKIKSWNENDEHHWMMCLECVEECATQEKEDYSKTIDWLKSLKNRMLILANSAQTCKDGEISAEEEEWAYEASIKYKNHCDQCGIKDSIILGEIELAYYAGALRALKKNVKNDNRNY